MALVSISRDGHIATLTLTRPDARNALSIEMCDAIADAIEELEATDARALVIAGEGRVFCSGADFAAVSGPGALDFLPAFERMLETVARCRFPTVASIHGAALGGGLQLATVCDFRIAAEDAKLGIPSSRLGIVINYENVQRLVLLVGVATAKLILMTGRTFGGTEAAHKGIVTEACPPEELAERVTNLATALAAGAPLAIQGTKRAIGVVQDRLAASRNASSGTPEDIDALVEAAYRSEDLAEGLRAMTEKRAPDFKGS